MIEDQVPLESPTNVVIENQPSPLTAVPEENCGACQNQESLEPSSYQRRISAPRMRDSQGSLGSSAVPVIGLPGPLILPPW